jgi:CubicO group peptidase (beta-lactamase class C family)
MDWARLGQLLLDEGRRDGQQIISADWITQVVKNRPESPYYGYQIWLGYNDPALPEGGAGSTGAVASEPFVARDTYLMWGRGQQHVWVVPSHQLVIVRLGPALGRAPIQAGFDVTRLPNLAVRDLIRGMLDT